MESISICSCSFTWLHFPSVSSVILFPLTLPSSAANEMHIYTVHYTTHCGLFSKWSKEWVQGFSQVEDQSKNRTWRLDLLRVLEGTVHVKAGIQLGAAATTHALNHRVWLHLESIIGSSHSYNPLTTAFFLWEVLGRNILEKRKKVQWGQRPSC